MELMQVSHKIEDSIIILQQMRSQLTMKAQDKSQAIAEYDKELAKTIIGLRNGESFEIEAYKVDSPPVTIMEKVSKGIIWKKKLEMDMAEAQYKNLLVKIEVQKTILVAWQSIFKNLSHV